MELDYYKVLIMEIVGLPVMIRRVILIQQQKKIHQILKKIENGGIMLFLYIIIELLSIMQKE